MNAITQMPLVWATLTKEERVSIIRDRSGRGYSALQIAGEFSDRVTRNIILGYWHRHAGGEVRARPWAHANVPPKEKAPVASRPKATKITRDQTVVVAPKPAKKPALHAVVWQQAGPTEPDDEHPAIPFLSRERIQCAWVFADRGPDGEAMCCGRDVTAPGESWCVGHYQKTHTKRGMKEMATS